jgi:hypothetical protein
VSVVLDEYQRVQPVQQDGIRREGSRRPGSWPRARAGTAATSGRPGAVPDRYPKAQDLIDSRRRDRRGRLDELAMNTPVSQSGFSFARRTASRAMLRTVAGRLGGRRLLVSYLLAASLRCQASSVAGVTGKTPVQRRRGMNRVSAVNHARSAGSYRTRPAFRRSTAFSCWSTSSPAFFAWYAEHQGSQAKSPAHEQVGDLEQHPASQPSPPHPFRRNGRPTMRSSFRAAWCSWLPCESGGTHSR